MSRIGKRIITIPENVTVTINDNIVNVKGPKGELSTSINNNISIIINENELKVKLDDQDLKHFYGTTNANIQNMIIGVTEGYEKHLETIGVGYRFTLKDNIIVVAAGYSNPIEVKIPEGIEVEVPINTQLIIKGIDKWLVGEFAANIRKIRKPEPYKGKGIRYKDERVIRKVGKKAAK